MCVKRIIETYERKGKLYKKSLDTDKFIMLSNAQIHILENFSKQFKHVFQIENENRKYILSTKS